MRPCLRTLVVAASTATMLLAPVQSAGATDDAGSNRLAGADRFVTARAIASATFSGSNVAILVSGRSYPEALASAYLSGAAGLPLLLTEPDHLPDGVIDTLNDLGVDGVQVIGGTASVSDDVITTLRDAGFTVDRKAAGDDRYDTARKIAELLPPEAVGVFGAGRAVILTTGEAFPDALAAGPISASQGLPILLTPGDQLNEHARAAIEDLGIEQVLVVGGTAAVSPAVVTELEAMGLAVRRVAGATRQDTAYELALVEAGELNYPMDRVMLARGDDFADAMAGGTRGGHVFAPVLLIQDRSTLGTAARTLISEHTATIGIIDILGGTAAILDAVAADAVSAARG